MCDKTPLMLAVGSVYPSCWSFSPHQVSPSVPGTGSRARWRDLEVECSQEGRQLFEEFLDKVCQERPAAGGQGKAICMAKRLRKVGPGELGTWYPPRTGPIPTATIGTIVKQPSSIIDGGNLNKSDMAVDVYPGNQSLQCEIPKWYPSIDEFTIKLFSIAKFDHQSHWKRSHAKCQPRIHTKNGDCPDPKSTSRNGIDDFLSTLYIYIRITVEFIRHLWIKRIPYCQPHFFKFGSADF